MKKDNPKEYIYIVQASLEPSKCKIGITNDLERRLKEYNSTTGKSKDNIFQYLFTCEVKNMSQVENDIKEEFRRLREQKNREIYFFNDDLFDDYVKFIKEHSLFLEEIFIKKDDTVKETVVKIVKKITPTLKERGLTRNEVMNKSKKKKDDEFYTRYEDIEKELSMYDVNIWKDKVVFCNCDDAVGKDDKNTSAFALYFIRNFKELNLKKLICTHYSGGIDLFNQGAKGYVFTYIFTKDGFEGIKEYPKGYDGSFDHPLSIKILNEEADIVCTNPPFSRSADYWKLIIESEKKFIILSNITNVKNKAYIHYFIENKVWAGYNRVDWFLNYKRQIEEKPSHWYTNFSVKNRQSYKRLKIMPLKEIPEEYKKYDDKKVLLVDNNYIPNDYEKPFAVSVRQILNGLLEKGYKYVRDKDYTPYINGKASFGRVLVQKI
jgi:predicted GIY-YIG superfamily endonuclease